VVSGPYTGAGAGGDAGSDAGSDSGLSDSGTDSGGDAGSVAVVTTATFSMDQTCPDIVNTATLVITLNGFSVVIQRTPTPGGADTTWTQEGGAPLAN
jgi:hypothetical protein